MRPHLYQIAFVGALGLVGACSSEQRPEAADRPPVAEAPAKPDVGDRTAAATETADVKLAISMDKTVDASDINVDTDAATKVVTLKGTVASGEQRARAEAIAVREATGFRVVNQLVVKRKAD
ncbi:MAG: BON domain-containing protein [Vicinamibacteraceae bacterium]